MHPLQALINFNVSVIAARLSRVVVAYGLDPAFGFLHDGRKPGRLSLIWDAVELHRPKLVRETFRWAGNKVFRKGDFRLIDEGVVRLAPATMKDAAELTLGVVPLKDMIKTVEWLIRQIRSVK